MLNAARTTFHTGENLLHSTPKKTLFAQPITMCNLGGHFTLPCLIFLLLTSTLCAAHDEEDWDYPDKDGWNSATATYTKDTNDSIITDGACGYGDIHKTTSYGNYTSALSTLLFNRGRICGACFEIRCINHIHWCLSGSPSIFITATDFCAPNNGLSSEYGGWCNLPNEHFQMSELAFAEIAKREAEIIPVEYRRVGCERDGGMKFTLSGEGDFMEVLITNVGSDGEVVEVKVKGERTGWVPMVRNWGQFWQCDVDFKGQALSFEVMTANRNSVSSYNVAPKDWKFGQMFEGKQIYD